jgi:hypothetical protein
MFGECRLLKEGYSIGYYIEVYPNALEMSIFSAHCDWFQWYPMVPLAQGLVRH